MQDLQTQCLEALATETCRLDMHLDESDFLKRRDPGSGDLVTDYNYIAVSGKSYTDIYNLLSVLLGVSSAEISKAMSELTRAYIEAPGYTLVAG